MDEGEARRSEWKPPSFTVQKTKSSKKLGYITTDWVGYSNLENVKHKKTYEPYWRYTEGVRFQGPSGFHQRPNLLRQIGSRLPNPSKPSRNRPAPVALRRPNAPNEAEAPHIRGAEAGDTCAGPEVSAPISSCLHSFRTCVQKLLLPI